MRRLGMLRLNQRISRSLERYENYGSGPTEQLLLDLQFPFAKR